MKKETLQARIEKHLYTKGGKNGYFVRLTAKGKRQVKDFATL